MIDLIDGIKHKDSGKVFIKHIKKLPMYWISFFSIVLAVNFYKENEALVYNAELVGVFVVMTLMWLKDMLSEICELSGIYE